MPQTMRMFPTPARGIPLRVERQAEQVVITGDLGVAAVDGPRPALALHLASALIGRWRWILLIPLVAGGMFILAALLLTAFGDQPLRFNDRPIHNRWLALAIVGAAFVGYVVVASVMLRGFGRTAQVLSGHRGTWQLTLRSDLWRSERKPVIGNATRREADPRSIRRLTVDAQGRVVADQGGPPLELTPPIDGRAATWLREALCRHLGIKP